MCVAWRLSACPRGSMTISFAPRLAAFLMKVAATGWLLVGLAPMTTITSASAHVRERRRHGARADRLEQARRRDEAWHSRVQWSTLLLPKPVRTSFWNR